MEEIKLFLADDHKILRDSLKLFLSHEQDMAVIGEASNGLEAYTGIMNLKPDVAIIDISMAQLNGLDLCLKLKQEVPEIHLIVLTMHKSEQHVYKALNIGVSGYVLKDNAIEDLVHAIRTVHSGRMFLSPDLLSLVVGGYLNEGHIHPTFESDALSVREREILQLLAEGRSNKEVAESLHLSVKTVETHRANIMKKLGLKNIADMVLYAVRNHLIEV